MSDPSSTTTEDVRTAEAGAARTFPCERCGADLTFHVGEQAMQCEHCGWTKDLQVTADVEIEEQDFDAMLERLASQKKDDAAPRLQEVNCESCAARVSFAGTITSSECPYCGVPLQLQDAHREADRIPVDGVLPFQVKRAQARNNLAQWVKSRWFAPNEFKKRGVQGRFTGLYVPYWTFDSLTSNQYSGLRGEHYTVTVGSGKNRRTVTKTRWYPAAGSFQQFFDDVLVVAGEGLPHSRLQALEPWPLDGVVPFTEELLAGFLARTYDVSLPDGFRYGKQRMDGWIRQEVKRRIGGDTQQIHHIASRYDAVTFKHLLLPVWILSYKYREKIYRVVVNACTGEVQGDRPYSAWKIALASIAAVVVAVLLVLFLGDQ